MPIISDVVTIAAPGTGAAIPTNGVTINAYKATRLGGPPSLNTAPPGGAVDGTAVSGPTHGGVGAWRITVATDEDYYCLAPAYGAWFGPYASVENADLVHLAGAETITGAKTFSGPLSAKNLNAIRFADQFPGASVAAQIQAANDDLAGAAGFVIIPSTMGAGFASSPGANTEFLDLRAGFGLSKGSGAVVQLPADVASRALDSAVLHNNATAESKPGTLTVPLLDKGGAVYNVESYTGTANQKITAAVADVVAAGGGKVVFAAKNYQLTGALVFNALTNVTFEGQGSNQTSIIVNGNYDAFTFTGVCSNIKIRDLWAGSFSVRTAGIGFNIQGTTGAHSNSFVVEDVVIQNMYGGALLCYFLDSSRFRNVQCIQSIAAAVGGVVFLFRDSVSCRATDLATQATAGTFASRLLVLDSNCDTIIINDSELLSSAAPAVALSNSLGGTNTGPRLCRLVNVLGESSQSGFSITDGRDCHFQGCHAAVNTQSGYDIAGGTFMRFVDCTALQNGNHGFGVSGGVNVKLLGCNASNNSTSSVTAYAGFRIGVATTHAQVIGCTSGDIVFAPATQGYGIALGDACDYCLVAENDLSANNVNFANFSTGTHNVVRGNIGYNPVGVVSPAVPATTVAVAAVHYDRTFYVTTAAGGLTMAIQGGPSIVLPASSFGTVRVPAGQTVTPTYTNAPTWVVEGE